MTSGAGRTINWTVFGKPSTISKTGNALVYFDYGTDQARYHQYSIDFTNNSYQNTWYIGGGLFEKVEKQSVTEYKYSIRAGSQTIAIKTERNNGAAAETDYLHRDYQGSIVAITREDQSIKAQLGFYAFGSRREVAGTSLTGIMDIVTRGYSGHEHLDSVGLIHMNGRVYDPELGRFLSADPTIQAPTNLQSYNRYSYVMNNPMTLVDPSGYSWLSQVGRSLHKFNKKYGRTIIALGIASAFPPGYAFWGGALSSYYSSGGSLKAALIGGFTAVAFGGLHADRFTWGGIITHGYLGGFLSVAQGGSFKDGFIGSAASYGVSWGGKSSWLK